MDVSSIINTLITGFVTLLVSLGTWHISMKKDRDNIKAELSKTINENHDEYIKGIQDVRGDVSDMGANLQQKVAVIEVQIDTLSNRVEKHNQVVERTYKLEQAFEDLKQRGA
jgi:hypothetical protein